jgi:DNA-binding CsgD family transcriptional regulator
LIDAGDPEQSIDMAEALVQLSDIRGSLTEAQSWLLELLSLPTIDQQPATRERILPLLGEVAGRHGDHATASWAYSESLAAYRASDDLIAIANALCALATVHFDQGEYERARRYLDESLLFSDRVKGATKNNWWYVAGGIALHEGRLADARLLLNQVIRGEPGEQLAGYCHKHLGQVAVEEGAYAEAREQIEFALSAAENLGDLNLLVCAFETFSNLAAALGQHGRAVCLASAASALREARGSLVPPAWERLYGRRLAISRAALPAGDTEAIAKIGQRLPLEQVVAFARDPLAAVPRHGGATNRRMQAAAAELTPRELEVAGLVALGLSNAQIAEQLVVSPRTVAAHVEHILNKLGFGSRTQVGVWAAERQRLMRRLS